MQHGEHLLSTEIGQVSNDKFPSISWFNGHSFKHSKNPGLKNYSSQNSGVTRILQSKESQEFELRWHKIAIKSVITKYEKKKRTQIRKHQEEEQD
jgi:hypothetical protein